MEERRQHSHLDRAHESDPAATGLQLVERTAELIRATEDHAADLVARSAASVAHMQEEMRLAERVLEAAETRRRAAETELRNVRTELEESTRSFQDRIDALKEDIIGLELRAERAEERAADAEHALNRIQTAMQGILKVRSNDPGQPGSSGSR